MDEKMKWMKNKINEPKRKTTTCLQPIVMCQFKLYLFTTESYVSIETPPVHFKKYVPIRNWDNMRSHILYTISIFYYLNSSFQTSNVYNHFWYSKNNYIVSTSPFKLPSSIFLTTTTCLQLLNIYFTMAKRKLTTMVTPNTLETMIEYIFISNILDKICELTKKPSKYSRDPTELNPSSIC